MSAKTATQYITLGGLGSLLVQRLVQGAQGSSDRLETIHQLEVAILAIATTQYGITIPMDEHRVQRWRYLDWLLTTPLLLRTFHLLAEEKGWEEEANIAILFNILMIIAGYMAEFTDQNTEMWYWFGFVCLGVVLVYVYRWNDYLQTQGVDTKELPVYFFLGWSMYGVGAGIGNNQTRQTLFNVLDLVNKGLYSISLHSVIQESFI